MSPEEPLYERLHEIELTLARMETLLLRADEDRRTLNRLETRVSKLESFQYKIIGAVLASGAFGGLAGAVIPLLLSL